jgi:hypothetical protein
VDNNAEVIAKLASIGVLQAGVYFPYFPIIEACSNNSQDIAL